MIFWTDLQHREINREIQNASEQDPADHIQNVVLNVKQTYYGVLQDTALIKGGGRHPGQSRKSWSRQGFMRPERVQKLM